MPLSPEVNINNLIVRFADYVRAFGESPGSLNWSTQQSG